MSAPATDTNIVRYYDEHAGAKLRAFVEGDDRIERAWQTLAHWAPPKPCRILEIGCGVGDICWRLGRKWLQAEIVGLDISPRSLEVARRLFSSPRVSFREGPLRPGLLAGPFDLIVLMDVYEHISLLERPFLHQAIRDLRSECGRVFLSFPTPHHLAWLRRHCPGEIQPVDEDITADTILALSRDLETEVLLYQEVKVWQDGDYAHAVLGRNESWPDPSPAPATGTRAGWRELVRGWVGESNTRRYRQARRLLARVASNSNSHHLTRLQRLDLVLQRLGRGAYPE